MKKRLLILSRYYLPAYLAGGPVRSVSSIVERLGDEFDCCVLTSDRDLGIGVPYSGVRLDTWVSVGKASVYYASSASQTLSGMLRILRTTPCDALYVNSFFDNRFSILPALAIRSGVLGEKRLLVAPRGEFSGGALQLKAFKKRAYLRLARWLGIYRHAHWHASTPLEAEDIARVFAEASVHVASVLSAPLLSPSSGDDPAPTGGELRICFLSRIGRMKNLDYAIRVLSAVMVPVKFSIYGPKEDAEYWEECKALMEALPANVRVVYEGAVPADQVGRVLAGHDLFFVPTRGENFGHVFVEAWSAGLPVLVSDRTPWRGLEHQGVGWDLPLEDAGAFSRAIESIFRLGSAERSRMREACRAFAHGKLHDETAVEGNRRMFHSVLWGEA